MEFNFSKVNKILFVTEKRLNNFTINWAITGLLTSVYRVKTTVKIYRVE